MVNASPNSNEKQEAKMRCKVKISYSDKGKIIAKLYSNGAMVTL